MVYAAVERPPFVGSSLRSCDDAEAKQVKGVQQVVMLELAKPPYGFKPLGGAAVLGHAEAMNRIGVLYAEGRGVPRDYVAALA